MEGVERDVDRARRTYEALVAAPRLPTHDQVADVMLEAAPVLTPYGDAA